MGAMRLAMLQRLREHSPGAGDGREYGRNDGGREMGYYPPRRYPGMTYGETQPPDGRRRGDIYDRRMGFGEEDDDDIGMRRRREGGRMRYGHQDEEREPVRFDGVISMEDGRRRHQRMTREIAEEWTSSMEGMDPAKPRGAKWTPEQVKPIATKYGVPTEGERFWEFYAVMNAMYSDYYAVAKKYNVLNPDYFADLAMAFINDKDAVENKAMMYYECIVEK